MFALEASATAALKFCVLSENCTNGFGLRNRPIAESVNIASNHDLHDFYELSGGQAREIALIDSLVPPMVDAVINTKYLSITTVGDPFDPDAYTTEAQK